MGEEINNGQIEEQKSEADSYSETPTPNLDASHRAMELMRQVESEPDSSATPLLPESEEVINKVIAIPFDYHQLRNKSEMQLVIESGYIETYNQITKGVISDALTKQPHRIAEWVQWSEDQRITEGWFLQKDNNIWQIGAFSAKDGYKATLIPYPDLKTACATFIKLQVEYTRKHAEENNQRKKRKK